MNFPKLDHIVTKERFDAVLTDTAKIHAACWKKMFDEFLRQRG